MTSTAIDLSAIRTDQTSYKGTFRALIGVYSTAEVDDLIAGVGGGSVVWGDIGGTLANQTDLQNALNAKQPIDATLTALAGVTTAADQVIYATGVDTFSVTALSAFGRSLIDDADASTARTTLGLGTIATLASSAKQDTDATLTALAGVTTAADKLIYATGSDTFSTTDFTSFARTLVDDTTASAARTTLGALGGSLGSVDNKVLRSDGTGGVTAQDSAVTIDDSGNVTGVKAIAISGGTVTASTPVCDISQTWNNAAVAFTGLLANFTTTASSSSSKLLDLQIGGVSILNVRPNSSINLPYDYAGLVDSSNNSGGSNYAWGGPRLGASASVKWSPGGPASSWDTGLNRNSAGIVEVNNGTSGTYRDLKARNITATALVFLGAYTVGTLPTASSNTGAMAYVTDSSVTTFNSTVSGGGSSVVPVFSNGTNWVVA